MKNNMTIKGWKVSELLMGLYIAAVLVGMPLFVTNAYYNINVDKYYYYCGACALLIPVLILKVVEKPSVKEFLKGLSLAEKALVVYWAIAGVSTLLSDYLYESFWGNEGRFSGLFLMTIYMIAYFVISRCYRPYPICIYVGVLTGCVTFLFGVTDFLSMDIFGFKEEIIQEQIHKFMSTLGNINFYASYAGLIAGAAAASDTNFQKRLEYVVWFILMTLSSLCVEV